MPPYNDVERHGITMQEREPDAREWSPADNPSLTRQVLCAQAEELAVELARWKVWSVEGHTHENLQEAQAMQALAMGLVELLDNCTGHLPQYTPNWPERCRCWDIRCKPSELGSAKGALGQHGSTR